MLNSVTLLGLAVLIVGSNAASFNEPCNFADTEPPECDRDKFLICNATLEVLTGVCVCEDDSLHIWDPKKESCTVRVGKECSVDDSTPKPTCTSNFKCLTNADNSTTCGCEDGYVANEEKFCQPTHGSPCNDAGSEEEKCFESDPSNFLVCKEHCVCPDDALHIWDEKKAACTLRVGKTCSVNDGPKCTSNFDCLTIADNSTTCGCKNGYVANGEHFCQPTHGSPCNDAGSEEEKCFESDPSNFLVCKNNCVCPDDALHIWDHNKAACTLRAGKVCSNTTGTPSCVSNAVCGGTGNCSCSNGFSGNNAGECNAAYDSACDASADTGKTCNPLEFTTCLESKCKCNPELGRVVDEGSKVCRSIVDKECTAGDAPGIKCIENAHCMEPGLMCMCNNNFEATSDKMKCQGKSSGVILSMNNVWLLIALLLCNY